MTVDQRRRLATQFQKLDKALVADLELIVNPATFMRWYGNLIAQTWDYSDQATRRGRPPLTQEAVDMGLGVLEKNPIWGDNTISNRHLNDFLRPTAFFRPDTAEKSTVPFPCCCIDLFLIRIQPSLSSVAAWTLFYMLAQWAIFNNKLKRIIPDALGLSAQILHIGICRMRH